jgi:hypothetical protein
MMIVIKSMVNHFDLVLKKVVFTGGKTRNLRYVNLRCCTWTANLNVDCVRLLDPLTGCV